MTWVELALVGLAGVAAGGINTVVGSGTLVTFPTLLAFGLPPVTANVSNTIGLVPGSIAGAVGYRRELRGQLGRVLHLTSAALLGGLAGGLLLLWLPDAFSAIVPVLVLLGIALVLLGPRISSWVARRHAATGGLPERGAWWVWPTMLACCVYGGYFGAAQGVLMMAVMGIGIDAGLQHLNAVKNVLVAIVNGVSGVLFALVASVDWQVVAVITVGSIVGGLLGASVGRRLPPVLLRWVIVCVGSVALVAFVVR